MVDSTLTSMYLLYLLHYGFKLVSMSNIYSGQQETLAGSSNLESEGGSTATGF